MTGIDIREALHEVAAATRAPDPGPGRLPAAGPPGAPVPRATPELASASAVAAATADPSWPPRVPPFVEGDGAGSTSPAGTARGAAPCTSTSRPRSTSWPTGRLTALDPQGGVHDLGLRSEEVIGWTSEFVYAYRAGERGRPLRRAQQRGGAGWPLGVRAGRLRHPRPGPGRRRSRPTGAGWAGSTSTDRLTVRDLKAGTDRRPGGRPRRTARCPIWPRGRARRWCPRTATWCLRHRGRAGGHPHRQGRLRRRRAGDPRPGRGHGPRRPDPDLRRVAPGTASSLDTVPGSGVLAPYGEHLVSVTSPATTRRRPRSGPPGRAGAAAGARPAAVRGLGRRRHRAGDDVRRGGYGALRVRGGQRRSASGCPSTGSRT